MCSNSHSSSSMQVDLDGTWISWFLSLRGNDFLCRVPIDYIEDKFNLTGLETKVSNYYQALYVISNLDLTYNNMNSSVDPQNVSKLYGLIHARYILTPRGIDDMATKYNRGDFGVCPRVYCRGQHVLPVGLSVECGESHVKVFCPSCNDVYQPRSRCALLDGAMFGNGFPHMFLMHFPLLCPQQPKEKYVPRLFGFKLYKKAPPSPKEEPNPPAEPVSAKVPKRTIRQSKM